jgi:uncharacterized repeat protein (TIGR01451 family)
MFTYRLDDGNGDSATATVTVTVSAVNDPPVAVGDAASTGEDTQIDIDVLANDTDPEAPPQTLTITNVSDPPNGTAVIINGGLAVRYTPDADYCNELPDCPTPGPDDSFSYTVDDGAGGTDTATVSVMVNGIDDQPNAIIDSATTAEDGSAGVLIDVLANDILGNNPSIGDQPVTLEIASPPSHGSAVVEAGQIRYTVTEANYSGADDFTYRVIDADLDSDVALVTITITPVNDDPVANDDLASTAEDNSVDIPVLANDTDIDGPGPFVIIGVTDPPNGTTQNFGTYVRYTPDADYNGGDSFSYTMSDSGGGTASANVSVTITPVNDSPVAADDAYVTNEDIPLAVAAPGVLGNDSDVDGDALTAELVSGTSNGAVGLAPDGSFTYAPNADFYGTDGFTYRAFDGSLYSNTATVTLTVNPVPPEIIVDKSSDRTSVVVGDTIQFTILWANLGPGTATGVVVDDSISGPCTITATSPSVTFPYAVGSVAEGEGNVLLVWASADGVGTCTNTVTLTSDRWDPPSSSAAVDITTLGSTSWLLAGTALALSQRQRILRAWRRRKGPGRSRQGRMS